MMCIRVESYYYTHLQRYAARKNKHVHSYDDKGEAEVTMCPVTKELELVWSVLRADGLANVCEGCRALLEDL